MRFGIFSLLTVFVLLMTGCSAIDETFGKEYLLVDDYYEQLEADIKLSFEEFLSSNSVDEEIRSQMNPQLDLIIAEIHSSKANTKLMIPIYKEGSKEVGMEDAVVNLVEVSLANQRAEIAKKLFDVSDGEFLLKSAIIDRGFWGSIWHFIREQWGITLIIMGIIGAIPETIEEIKSKSKSDTEN